MTDTDKEHAMAVHFERNPHSTASIAGHPIHPMLVQFPIVFFISAFLSDLVFRNTTTVLWANTSSYLLGAGLIMAVLAAATGATDAAGDRRIRNMSDLWFHAGGNVLVVILELFNWYLRHKNGPTAIIPTGLLLSLVSVIILGFTGWKGGTLVYRRRIGVSDDTDRPAG
jgi:uncharacterized membrane protein